MTRDGESGVEEGSWGGSVYPGFVPGAVAGAEQVVRGARAW
jgi:hypothetical protein